jgi:hypothetical protein
LYENLDLLKRATNGAFNVYDHPLIANIGRFIYRAYIDYPYFVNFSDADAMMSSRPFIIYCYGRDIGDTVMQNFGAFLAQQQGWGAGIPGGKIGEQLQKLAYLEEIDNARAENALVGTFWLPQTEICGARDAEGTSAGFFFAAKGSHNGESHNHNDVGTCVLYYNGQPCLIDLGRQTYTAKTFGERRYEIWTMQSQYHNVPVINGMGQGAGLAYRAEDAHFHDDNQSVLFSVDIARAYPADAQVEKWTRSYRLHRQVDFRIRDAFELKERTAAATRLHFMTSCTVSQPGADCLILTGSGFMVQMQYNARKVRPVVEYIEVTDPNLREDWPAGVTRIAFDWIGKGTTGKHEIVITAMD